LAQDSILLIPAFCSCIGPNTFQIILYNWCKNRVLTASRDKETLWDSYRFRYGTDHSHYSNHSWL